MGIEQEVQGVIPQPTPIVAAKYPVVVEQESPAEVKQWSAGVLARLAREQFSIDWARDPGARLMGAVRARKAWFVAVLSIAYLILQFCLRR